MARKIALFIGYGVLALFVIAAAGAVWAGLIAWNLSAAPSVPWCLPALLLFLYLLWEYLGGKGWPRGTAIMRRHLRRANAVSAEAFAWTAVAGGCAIAALAGLWIVMSQLFRMPPNRLLPANFVSSPLFAGAIIAGASILAPITEVTAVRGYLQTVLEKEYKPAVAIVLSSLVFAAAHVSQGAALPKLLVYFLVGVTFGTMVRLNDSILPVIPVHFAGDVTFFLLIWPNDAIRRAVRESGAGPWSWVHLGQVVVFAFLTVFALRRLSLVRPRPLN